MEGNIQCNLEFWKEIEIEINETIPELLKVLFTKCGYDSRMSLRNIKLDDIITVERFVAENLKDLLKQLLDTQAEYSNLKLFRGQSFEFLPGHRKRILAIGEILADGREIALSHRKENETFLRPLQGELSSRLKDELFNNIMKWAKSKKIDRSVSEYIFGYFYRLILIFEYIQLIEKLKKMCPLQSIIRLDIYIDHGQDRYQPDRGFGSIFG